MITYKLAKQLKEAGFPETEEHCPTLSELIEACVKEEYIGFECLHIGISSVKDSILKRRNWAVTGFKDNGERVLIEHCKTPEEAVAKLWLKLNK